jgi:AcrR family transcriptional regulator
MVAAAALEVGLDGLTVRSVADHLGVSVAALYHHVSGKEELVGLALQHSAAKVPVPVDVGQHWAVWLRQWARYNRDAFLAEPALLARYLGGDIASTTIAARLEEVLRVLVRGGFTLAEANAAYDLVTSCALGSAVGTIRARQVADGGPSVLSLGENMVGGALLDEVPTLAALFDEIRRNGGPTFDAQITTVLRGIAAERGDRWKAVQAALDADRR